MDVDLESTKVVSSFGEEDTDSDNNKKEASQEEEEAKQFAETSKIFSFLFLPSQQSSFYVIHGEV